MLVPSDYVVLPYARVEYVGEYGYSDPCSRARHHLDELPPPLEVLAQHHRRRLAHHRVANPEQEAVAEINMGTDLRSLTSSHL